MVSTSFAFIGSAKSGNLKEVAERDFTSSINGRHPLPPIPNLTEVHPSMFWSLERLDRYFQISLLDDLRDPGVQRL